VGTAIVLHAVSLLPTIVLGFLFVIQEGLGFGGIRKLAHVAAIPPGDASGAGQWAPATKK
jgi:hypothetical protein